MNSPIVNSPLGYSPNRGGPKIPSKLEVAPPPKCGLGEWVIPLRLLQLLEHLAVLKIFNIAHKMMIA